MMIHFLLCLILVGGHTRGLVPISTMSRVSMSQRIGYSLFSSMSEVDGAATTAVVADPSAAVASSRPPPPADVDPKEVVKIFGRLAEKYIMLDESGGMCCYSACKDCEYRLPDGGYKMADQSAARPKWIPVYEDRVFANVNKEHTAKWKTGLFGTTTEAAVASENDNDDSTDSFRPSLTKDEFVSALVNMEFVPPLGGPFVSKTAATIEDTTLAEYVFDVLSGGKEKLSRYKMSLGLKDMADGEQGLTWAAFSAAMGL
jgi:hypothetical protein